MHVFVLPPMLHLTHWGLVTYVYAAGDLTSESYDVWDLVIISSGSRIPMGPYFLEKSLLLNMGP